MTTSGRISTSNDGRDGEESEGLFMSVPPESPLPPISPSRAQASRSAEDLLSPASEILSIFSDDDDEDLEDEEGDESNVAYCQTQEPLPELAAFDDDLGLLKIQTTSALIEVRSELNRYAECSSEIMEMSTKAGSIQSDPKTKKPVIMLLGDTGAGKSSTTNSFVDTLDASKAVAAGKSCTCVPTMITSAAPGQTSALAAELVFFDSETRENFLRNQIANYIQYNFEADSDWTKEEIQEYCNLAETAEKILRALFCDKPDFESPGALKKCLRSYHKHAAPQLLGDMLQWCEVLFKGYESSNNRPFVRYEAPTVEELNLKVDPHVFESPTFELPSLWPLVEHLRKCIKDSRILEHVTLLDLPGTSDSNGVRSSIAHKFIQQSEALWVVTPLARLISDARADLVLAQYGERFGQNVAIIATGSDDGVDDRLAHHMHNSEHQSIGNYWALSREIKQWKGSIAHIDTKLKRIRARKRPRTLSGPEEIELRESKDDHNERLLAVRNEQFESLVDVRNSFVARTLQADKQKYLKTDEHRLAVFCISNTQYAALKGVQTGDSRQMSAMCTGIPKLRAHALRLAAPAEFRTAETYIMRVITLVRGLELWVEAPTDQRYASLAEVAKQPQQILDVWMDKYREASSNHLDIEILRPLDTGRGSFVSSAVNVKRALSQWHHSTIGAFFRKDGKHTSGVKGYKIWNEDFTQEQTKIVDPAWNKFTRQQDVFLSELVGKLIASLRQIPEQLNSDPGSISIPVEQFKTLLDLYAQRIRNTFDGHVEELQKRLANVKQDASRDVESAFFTKHLASMYEAGRAESGTGSTARKLKLMEDWLLRPDTESPFAAVSTGLKKNLNEATKWMAESIQADFEAILGEMALQFSVTLRQNAENPTERAARDHIREFLQVIKPKINEIEQKLRAIKQKHHMKAPDADDE